MKFISARIFALHIPFKTAFSHSAKTRAYSDSIIVKVTADSGDAGFGEAAPRPYVTGESVVSCIDQIVQVLLPALARHHSASLPESIDPITIPSMVCSLFPETGLKTAIVMNASKAAIELACIDCILRHSDKPFSVLAKPLTDSVTYSSVITADTIETVSAIAQYTKQHGIRQVKVKVGKGDDIHRIAAIREILGEAASLRLDANGAFDENSALSFIELLQPYRIECLEQPIPRGDVKALARIKSHSPIPIMADESLITINDALELIDNNACDYFNVRISKNGGIYQTLQLVEIARKAGIGIQFGCQVGETAILSAAQRHIAAHYPEVMFVEGSFGTHLLKEDVAREPVMFDQAGKAPLLTGKGLGIDVCENILLRYSEKVIDVALDTV